ncbi:MAG: hypothetical protein QOI42_839 [Frankiaceae bacterium]|jgi:hypothetical protein|nr:hypothetical protein [Frankiaceae bacterium]
MANPTEARALREVRERLVQRFPELGPEVVEAAVHTARAAITGPVMQYIPILVEHAARQRLVDIT